MPCQSEAMPLGPESGGLARTPNWILGSLRAGAGLHPLINWSLGAVADQACPELKAVLAHFWHGLCISERHVMIST